MTKLLNRCFDYVRPELTLWGRRCRAYHVFGSIGWIAGISLAMLLTRALDLAVWVTAVLALAAIGTFLGLTMLTKLLTGEEVIVYYHHEIAVLVVSTLLLRLLRQPVLPYLDTVIVGLGLFLACGRVGCLMVGCCHGRPYRWGVRYCREHAEAGFPGSLVGVRLFPIQLVESLFVLGTIAVATALTLQRAQPGAALAFYSIVYGSGRFFFEWLRGDAARPYWRGLSEAQWTTVALMGATTVVELVGGLPWSRLHAATTCVVTAAAVVVAVTESPSRRIFRAGHVREVAALIAAVEPSVEGRYLYLGQTSLGVRISASTVEHQGQEIAILAFSSPDAGFSVGRARRFARLIRRLRRTGGDGSLVKGRHGVYHLVLPTQESAYAL